MFEPRLTPRTGPFIGVQDDGNLEPQPESGGFTLQLFLNGNAIGYIGSDLQGWCYIQDSGIVWMRTPVGIGYFYRVVGNSPFTGHYLSVSTGAAVGLYSTGSVWTPETDGTLVSSVNNQKLSSWSPNFNRALYAWDSYSVLTVKEIAQ